jgi:hypothetical protein
VSPDRPLYAFYGPLDYSDMLCVLRVASWKLNPSFGWLIGKKLVGILCSHCHCGPTWPVHRLEMGEQAKLITPQPVNNQTPTFL